MTALDFIRSILARYTFTPLSEADLQAQVASALAAAGVEIDREVLAERGRYDIVTTTRGARVVIELKLAASAPAVERQAQRYALTEDVDAVVVVTTSYRLAAQLAAASGDTLGGKPFAVIALRAF